MKAGHARALRRLSLTLVRYRCPVCLANSRCPRVKQDGAECSQCGEVDTARPPVIEQEPTRSGFRWVARLTSRSR